MAQTECLAFETSSASSGVGFSFSHKVGMTFNGSPKTVNILLVLMSGKCLAYIVLQQKAVSIAATAGIWGARFAFWPLMASPLVPRPEVGLFSQL